MAIYQPVHVKIWNDPWFLGLKPDGKFLFMYLLTSPENNTIGIYPCPITKMAFETGLSVKRCLTALEAVRGRVEYDDSCALVWIVNAAKYWSRSPKVKTAQRRELNEVGNHPFVDRFRERYPAIFIDDDDPIDTPPIGYARGTENEPDDRVSIPYAYHAETEEKSRLESSRLEKSGLESSSREEGAGGNPLATPLHLPSGTQRRKRNQPSPLTPEQRREQQRQTYYAGSRLAARPPPAEGTL